MKYLSKCNLNQAVDMKKALGKVKDAKNKITQKGSVDWTSRENAERAIWEKCKKNLPQNQSEHIMIVKDDYGTLYVSCQNFKNINELTRKLGVDNTRVIEGSYTNNRGMTSGCYQIQIDPTKLNKHFGSNALDFLKTQLCPKLTQRETYSPLMGVSPNSNGALQQQFQGGYGTPQYPQPQQYPPSMGGYRNNGPVPLPQPAPYSPYGQNPNNNTGYNPQGGYNQGYSPVPLPQQNMPQQQGGYALSNFQQQPQYSQNPNIVYNPQGGYNQGYSPVPLPQQNMSPQGQWTNSVPQPTAQQQGGYTSQVRDPKRVLWCFDFDNTLTDFGDSNHISGLMQNFMAALYAKPRAAMAPNDKGKSREDCTDRLRKHYSDPIVDNIVMPYIKAHDEFMRNNPTVNVEGQVYRRANQLFQEKIKPNLEKYISNEALQALTTIINNRQKIAIVTHSQFPTMVSETLDTMMNMLVRDGKVTLEQKKQFMQETPIVFVRTNGCSAEYKNHVTQYKNMIAIEGGDNPQPTKTQHVSKACEYYGINTKNGQVLLVDDGKHNIDNVTRWDNRVMGVHIENAGWSVYTNLLSNKAKMGQDVLPPQHSIGY